MEIIEENFAKTIADPKLGQQLVTATRMDRSIPGSVRSKLGINPTKEKITILWTSTLKQILRPSASVKRFIDLVNLSGFDPLDKFGPWLLKTYIRGLSDYDGLVDYYGPSIPHLGNTSLIGALYVWQFASTAGILPTAMRDLNYYDDIGEISDVLAEYEKEIEEAVESKKAKKLKKSAKFITIINNENLIVSIPLNYGGCYLANVSQPLKDVKVPIANWCTGASEGSTMFPAYAKQGLMINIICKNTNHLKSARAIENLKWVKEQEPNFNPLIVMKWQIQSATGQIVCAAQYSAASDEVVFAALFPGLMRQIVDAIMSHENEIDSALHDNNSEDDDGSDIEWPLVASEEAEQLKRKFPIAYQSQEPSNPPNAENNNIEASVEDIGLASEGEGKIVEHWIFDKIEHGTVTKEDFDQLFTEATPEAIRDRIRRRMKVDPTENHLDSSGHQPLAKPKMAARVQPNRRKPSDVQMNGHGKAAHKQSARTQKRRNLKRK